MKTAINAFAENIDVDLRKEILEEGINVFKLNNTIIASVKGVDQVLRRRLLKMLIAIILLVIFLMLTWSCLSDSNTGESLQHDKIPSVEL